MTRGNLSAAHAALMSDAELVERVLDGERDLFHALVQRYQQPLYRVAFGMVMDDDVAADLVQDSFVRAFANLGRCRDPQRFRVWLFATLRHRGLDWLREKRRRDISLDDHGSSGRIAAAAAESDDAERIALRSELEVALARLSEPLREAFVLKHVEQLTVAEVAELLGITASAVKMRLLRAREQLQGWLAPAFDTRVARSADPPPTGDVTSGGTDPSNE